MKALVWHGDQRISFEEVPPPTAGRDEVLLDVELAGICGSDLHGYRGHPGPRVPPLILGHEVVGSSGGMRYTVYPVVGCGKCSRCFAGEDNLCAQWQLIGMHRPGVFAEQVAVPRRSLVAIPAGLDLASAVLAEPLACCVGALAPHDIGAGSTLTVIGAGPIGLLAIHLAHHLGARVTAVDPVTERLATAQRLGAGAVVTSLADLAPGRADVVLDAAGFEATWRGAIDAAASGGTVVVLGLGDSEGRLPMAVLVRRGIALRGQFAYSRADFARAVEILLAGDLDRGWITSMALRDGAQAFADLVGRPREVTKVLLTLC